MHKVIRVSVLVVVILLINLYGKLFLNEWQMNKEKNATSKVVQNKKNQNNSQTIIHSESIIGMIEMNESEVLKKFGKPNRVEPSGYGFEWWVYNDYSEYTQFGIKDNKVVTVYGAGRNVDIAPFKMGQRYEELYGQQLPVDMVSFSYKEESYQVTLTEEELLEKPLLQMGNTFVQLYFDKFTHLLSSIRIMDKETLLRYRPYKLTYTGQLPFDDTSAQKTPEVQRANELEIFDLTNVAREKQGLSPLKWSNAASVMAYKHSKDMSVNHYFDHVSPQGEDLQMRLSDNHISYIMAGENIAAQYSDGIAAVEGWMNSEGHRINILNKNYTLLGVGVYEKYYTQNFLKQ